MTNVELGNLIKYAKEYLGIINPARQRSNVRTNFIKSHILDPKKFLSSTSQDESFEPSFPINCELFYSLKLEDIDELEGDDKDEYQYQREIINQLDEIRLKGEANTFTKQVQINLGYIDLTASQLAEVEVAEEDDGEESKFEKQKIQFPVFTIPIKIDVLQSKFSITLLDTRVTPSFSFLSRVLEQDQYFEFQKNINDMEMGGDFELPLNLGVLEKVYEELLSQLKRCEGVSFHGEPLDINYLTISLGAKSNFFMAQDLEQLAEMSNEELLETSLSGLVDERELDEVVNLGTGEGDVYFPFASDKHQRGALKLINNRAAIVQGPPGTGKSQTIANIICHLVANDKRVLFVSQKDQAVRVVKDSLKSLEVPGLFGYIPDRYSSLHSKQDEIDSAANELARLKFVVDNPEPFGGTFNPKQIEESVDEFNSQLSIERKYFNLSNQLRTLEEFNININNPKKFIEGNPLEEIKQLRKTIQELEDVSKFISDNRENVAHYKKEFPSINLDYYENVSGNLERLKIALLPEISTSGFKPLRGIRNRVSLAKHSATLSALPYEVSEFIKKSIHMFNSYPSKSKLGEELDDVEVYFRVLEAEKYLPLLKAQLENQLYESGTTMAEYEDILNLISKHGEQAIQNIIKVLNLKDEIKQLKLHNINELNRKVHKARLNHQYFTKKIIANKIRSQIEASWNVRTRGLVERAVRGFSKSKRAYKTFDKLKSDPEIFNTVLGLFPVWMMSLDDVSRIIPLDLNLFDYVIIDEASQCNLAYAIPSMVRAKHTILFGDTLQMRDSTIRFKSNITLLEMAKKYSIPDHIQIKSEADSVKSIMDIGVLLGFQSAVLRTHYRSPRELIGFSNEWFYKPRKRTLEIANATFRPYKDTRRVMLNHIISTDRSKDESAKTNVDEAEYIKELIAEIKADPSMKDMDIAVLSFFTEQAALIRKTIEDESVKVSNIEGIQGDERDIVIYSMVISDPSEKRRYISLAGEGGEITRELSEGRVNVAFTRAKQQVHVVTSLNPEQWPDGIWIKRYLEYVDDFGRGSRLLQDGVDETKFDSNFERDFYLLLKPYLDENYILQNQVESCGYKLDFALLHRNSSKRLAIECDGPTHFEQESDDTYVQSDWERQSVLEAAKWEFYRVPYSRWDQLEERQQIVNEVLGLFKAVKPKTKAEKELPEIKSQVEPRPEPAHIQKIEINRPAADAPPVKTERPISSTPRSKQSDSSPAQEKSDFKRVGLVKVSDNRALVISSYYKNSRLIIAEHVRNSTFTGFTKRNVCLNKGDVDNFVDALNRAIEQKEPSELSWAGSTANKIMVSETNNMIDIRQWINSDKYTGYTRNGFRLDKAIVRELIGKLGKDSKASSRLSVKLQ